jgi:hypothetical protein
MSIDGQKSFDPPRFAANLRAFAPYRMIAKLHICLISAALALGAPIASASDTQSLYNRKTAQKLDVSKLSLFGPQAGKFKYDKRMIHAAEIAAARARAHSTSKCWRYVKDALLAAKIVDTRPKTGYAKQAAAELTKDYGFKRIKETNPYKAPVGSVIVYGGKGAGHVEFRTAQGFVSDFVSLKPSPRPLIGIYIKPRA